MRVEPQRAIRQCDLVLNWFAESKPRDSADAQ